MFRRANTRRVGLASIVPPLVLAFTCCTNPILPTPAGLPANFHLLPDGKAYRSAQPTGDQIAAAASRYDIRTVINLRGSNLGKPWYDEEVAACQSLGLRHVDLRISANELPDPDALRAIVQTLRTSEFPVLIHCEGGADRTGLVSAIYRMLILGDDRGSALSELSLAYLHFRDFTPCMDALAAIYEPNDGWLDWYAANFEQLTCQ